jgi:hypothetical protein
MNYFGNHTLLHDQRVRLADNWMPERGVGVVNNRSTEASRGSWAEIWRIDGDIDPDTPDQRGIQEFFPASDPADACGTIGAWAWGLQRAVDYLVTVPGIDPKGIVVTGHSRLGKAALLAAAFDDRIAIAIPHQAGCGGSAPSRALIAIGKPYNTLDTARTKSPETVADINDKFPHWFRYRRRPNLLMFTVANEFERFPDGKYEFSPADVDWARRIAARIRTLDPELPIGCHPSVWITDQDAPGHGASGQVLPRALSPARRVSKP